MNQDRIRVLVVEDHTVMREGLCALIDARSDMKVAGEAADGVEGVRLAATLRPDVILMDLVMPKKDGIAAIGDIVAADPGARILVLTSYAEDERVCQALKAGALGYLLKDSSSKELIEAIREVRDGNLSLPRGIALNVIREMNRPRVAPPSRESLTEREVEVLALIARGQTNQEIADALTVSERTVIKHVSNILSKLHLTNRTQAALYAVREGLAGSDPPA